MIESYCFWRFRGWFVVRRQNAFFWNEILPVLNILHFLNLSHFLSMSLLFLLHQKLADQRLILINTKLFSLVTKHHHWLAWLDHITIFALWFRFTIVLWLWIVLQVALIISWWHYQEFIHNHLFYLPLGEFAGYFLFNHKFNAIMQLLCLIQSKLFALLDNGSHRGYTVCFRVLIRTLLSF